MGFAVGENVGPYRIIAQLGSGGMATVYKAYHAALDRYVALKVMHAAFKEDPGFLGRFQREARIVARLEHPHIVPVYDFSEHEGQSYLVMRFVEGETLKARLQSGLLSISEVMEIMRPVCQALAYAHEQGVVHRDIKPSNILITPQKDVFLTDFGLARIAQAGESTLSQDTLLGTPQYISPEQAQGLPDLDARTDIYSLGVVLYELMVGRVPFKADTPYATIHDHIFTPLPMPRSLNPDLPEPFERVLLKALSKERNDRYATVGEMQAALEKAAESAPTVVAPAKTVSEPAPSAFAGAPRNVPGQAQQPEAAEAPAAPARKSRRVLWIALAGAAVLTLCCALVLAINFFPARQHLQKARQLRSQGQVEPALAEYEAAAQADRKLTVAYTEPAEILMNRGQPGDFLHAGEICERGLQSNPNNVELQTCAARAWFATNDLNRAQPHLEWLIQNKPGDALPHAGIALLMLERGQVDGAQQEAQRAIALDENAPEGHLALGLIYVKRNQPVLAREQFRIALNSSATPRWLRDRIQQLADEFK